MTLSNILSIGAHKHAEAGEEEVRVALLLVDPWLQKISSGLVRKSSRFLAGVTEGFSRLSLCFLSSNAQVLRSISCCRVEEWSVSSLPRCLLLTLCSQSSILGRNPRPR